MKEINYKYGLYTNYKALRDYHIKTNIDDNYLTNNHCVIMAFIVEEYYKNKNMPSLEISKKRYVLLNTNYILDNLIFLKFEGRMLKNYLVPLKKNGLIEIHIERKKDRYVHVNRRLIELWYSQEYSISAIGFLSRNKSLLWKSFVNEWEPMFKSRNIDFKHFIDNFNDTRAIKNDNMLNSQEIYDHLINATEYKLYGKKS